MHILKSFVIVLSLFASASYAQEEIDFKFKGKKYFISYKLEENLQTIRLHGEIYDGIFEDLSGFKKVINLIRKDVPVKLVLHSGGGYLRAFKRLPETLKKNCDSETSNCRITTVIPTWAYCASACVHVFMVGDDRLAGKDSRFGFHQASAVPGLIKLSGFAEKTLIKAGVSADWIEANKELFSSLEKTWVYPRGLEDSNILTGLSEAWES